MNDLHPVERPQVYIPTYVRVWEYRWLIRGIPNGPTFWRPIEGRAAVVFAVVLVVEWIVLRRLHIRPGLYGGVFLYLGIPFLSAWFATQARLGGKRLDRWLLDRLEYRLGPKVHDRFRSVDQQPQTILADAPVMVRHHPEQ